MTLSVLRQPPPNTVSATPEPRATPSSDSAPPSNPRARGDSQLVQNFISVLKATRGEYAAAIEIPPNSTLGQWRTQMAVALKNPDFQEWIKSKGITPASIVILPDSNSISEGINHQRVTFNLTDNCGWSAVAAPILAAGKVLASGGQDTVHYNDAFRNTFELGKVAHFYGLPDLTKATIDELERTHAFTAVAPTDAYRSPSIRGEKALSEQQRAVADIYKRHDPTANPAAPGDAELLEGFTRQWQRKIDGIPVGLITVPHQTVLGQWLGHYRTLFEGPVVQNWLREQKIDPATVKVVPSTGAMSAKVGEVQRQFSLNDTSGWRQIAGPLLDAANVIAPGHDQALSLSFGSGFIGASMKVIATFYGEPNTANANQSQQRVHQLNRQKTFDAQPNVKQSMQALETQRTAAGQFYTQAPQKLAYTTLATGVTHAMPNLRAEAKQVAQKILRAHLPADQLAKLEPLDADKLYLHQFQGGVTESRARSGWEHPNEEPHQSRTLTEAVMSNFSWHDQLPGELNVNGGIYTEGPGQSKNKGYGARNEFPFTPSVFMRGVKDSNFQAIADKKIAEFWTNHESDFRTVAKGTFVDKARQQLKDFEAKSPTEQTLLADEYKFSRDDYKLVMGAASNVPADENTPITLDQLQAEAPVKGKLRAHAFDLKGYPSDIIRFAELDDGQYNYENNRRDGKQILWIPGATPAFLRFDSLKKMDDWVVDQAKDPQKREALASHFSSYNRQDGGAFGKYGVDSSLAHLASGDWENWEGKTIDRGDIKIEKDVFTHVKDEAKTRMSSDADIAIKSNGEVRWDTFLNDVSAGAQLLAKLAPLGWPAAGAAVVTGLTEVVLGVKKAVSGDTNAERKDGAWKVFDGTLNTLFSAGASGVAKDPFELPSEGLPPAETPSMPVGEGTPTEPQPGPSGTQPRPDAPDLTVNRFGVPSQAPVKMSSYAYPDAEESIKFITPDALGVYRLKDAEGADISFVHYTDETGTRGVFEIMSGYKAGDTHTSIVNPKTGRAVIKIRPGHDGEWKHESLPGAGRNFVWPWQRSASTTSSNESISTPKFSQRFLDVKGSKIPGTEKFDDYFNLDGSKTYTFDDDVYEQGSKIKRKLTVSWKIDDGNFAVTEGERALPGTGYSSSFAPDLGRETYSIITKENGNTVRTELNFRSESSHETIQRRLEQFEATIPDAELRSRISEVAHQGASFPAFIELSPPVLKDNYSVSAGPKQFTIAYDPTLNVHTVNARTQWILKLYTDDGTVPNRDLDITTTRTFTIRKNSQAPGETYTLDNSAPTKLEISTPTHI